jgi:hypothetical protein
LPKCGLRKIKEIKDGIILDNLNVESYTENILKESESLIEIFLNLKKTVLFPFLKGTGFFQSGLFYSQYQSLKRGLLERIGIEIAMRFERYYERKANR